MSELPAGTLSLEDDAPPPPPVDPPAPPAPESHAPPANQEDADPEGTVVNPGGEKLVPLSVVAKLREEKRTLHAEIGTLKPKAEKVDQIVQEWQAAQPMLERAKQLANQPPPQTTPPAPKGPLSDQEALEYAKDLDLYKADGQPDTDRAQRLASKQQAIAEKQAQQYVQPLVQHTAATQSRANFEQAAAFKDQNTGIIADRGILQSIWSNVPPEISAQPHMARVLWAQAVAETVLQGKWKPGNAPPPPPPAHTESLGGGPGKVELDHVQRGFATAAGIKTKDFEEMSARFKPGERNSLE